MARDNNLTSFDDNLADASLAISPAFDLPLIEDLPDPFPLEKLETGEFLVIVKRSVSEAIRCDQVPDALELIVRLRLLKESKQQRPDLSVKYQPLIDLLKFVSLAIRKDLEIIRLFEQGLLAALQAGIDVKDKIQSRLTVYGYYEPDDAQFVRNLIYALEHNEEVLGTQPLQIIEENRKLAPNLGNWLKDYNAKSKGRSGSVGRAAYMSQSANARRLVAREQKVLLNVLELYDFLRDISNRLFAAGKALGMAKVENIRLPEALFAGGSGKGGDANKPTLPRPAMEEKIASDEVLKSTLNGPGDRIFAPQAKPIAVPEKAITPPSPFPYPGEGTRPVEDIRQIRQEIEKKKEEAQVEIDKKLDNLKKRQTPVK